MSERVFSRRLALIGLTVSVGSLLIREIGSRGYIYPTSERFPTSEERFQLFQEKARNYEGFLYWPLEGLITQQFGNEHEGIDISLSYDGMWLGYGARILAAADGRVVELRELKRSYGMYLVIDHKGGLRTLSAHNSKVHVDLGQEVKRGDLVARVGTTGRTTGPHLHFEVHLNGRPVNPLAYLP